MQVCASSVGYGDAGGAGGTDGAGGAGAVCRRDICYIPNYFGHKKNINP